MSPINRHVNSIKRKVAELINESFSFVNLIAFMLFEALVLFLFVKLHEIVQDCLAKSPWCPMRVAAIFMSTLFLLLNIQYVIVFVIRHSRANVRSLRSTNNNRKRKD